MSCFSIKSKSISFAICCALFSISACASPLPVKPVATNNADNSVSGSENIYTATALDKKENYLNQIAKNLAQYQFVPLRAGNTTQTAWIVQNHAGNNIALLKCTSGNNYAQAEVATYDLGRMLNFPLYPVTVGVTLDKTLANQLKVNTGFCALKEWLTNYSIMYWKSQANLEKIVKQNQYAEYRSKNSFLSSTGDRKKLADTLMCQNNLADIKDTYIELSSGIKTRNGNPLINNRPTAFVTNKIPLIQVAKDFSNLMVIDAVIGNGDRFPGLNLEFRSSTNQAKQLNNQVMMILNPRLSSLDTGLSFKGWPTSWARQEMTYYLRRFDPDMIQRLQILQKQLNQLTPADLQTKWRFLNFNTQMNPRITAVAYLKTNIQWVLNFVNTVQNQQNKEYIPGKKPACNQIWLDNKDSLNN